MERTEAREALLEYFDMLMKFTAAGYLEIIPARNEVYITRPAIHALANTDDLLEQLEAITKRQGKANVKVITYQMMEKIFAAASRLCDWCMWLKASDEGFKLYRKAEDGANKELANEENIQKMYQHTRKTSAELERNWYAVNVVGSESPYPILYTIVVTIHRRWWWPFKRVRKFEVIRY